MLPPDPARISVPDGRYNHAGQAYWYLTTTKDAAAAEAVDSLKSWLGCSLSDEKTMRVVDVRAWEADDERFFDGEGNPSEVPLSAVALVFTDCLKPSGFPGTIRKSWYIRFHALLPTQRRKQGFQGSFSRIPRHYDDNLVLFQGIFSSDRGGTGLYDFEHRARIRGEGLFFFGGFPMPLAAHNPTPTRRGR